MNIFHFLLLEIQELVPNTGSKHVNLAEQTMGELAELPYMSRL